MLNCIVMAAGSIFLGMLTRNLAAMPNLLVALNASSCCYFRSNKSTNSGGVAIELESIISHYLDGGVAEWLRCSVSNHARCTRVGSNPFVGTTNHKPTANSAVHPSEVGK